MKYIDADKLIAEIERRKDEWQALINKNNAVNPTAVKEVICEDLNILDIIASLQQELQESGSSEKPNNPIRGYDEAYLNEYIAKASKTWEGVDADKYLDEVRGREQEQSEVDLQKILDSPVQSTWHIIGGKMALVKRYSDEQVIQAHELGLNAGKED